VFGFGDSGWKWDFSDVLGLGPDKLFAVVLENCEGILCFWGVFHEFRLHLYFYKFYKVKEWKRIALSFNLLNS
jgi:hypothetical protein